MRHQLETDRWIVNVLPGEEIHVAIKLVVGRKKIEERIVLGIGGIAVTGPDAIFQTDSRFPFRFFPGVTQPCHQSERLMIERFPRGIRVGRSDTSVVSSELISSLG